MTENSVNIEIMKVILINGVMKVLMIIMKWKHQHVMYVK